MRFLKDLFWDGYEGWGVVGFVLAGLGWILGLEIVPEGASWAWAVMAVAAWVILAYHKRWSDYQELAAGAAAPNYEKVKREDLSVILGMRLSEGEKLIELIQSEDHNDPDARIRVTNFVMSWVSQTRQLIEAAFGLGEAALFESSSGFTFMGGADNSKSMHRRIIDVRLRRLTDLIQRSPTLQLKDDFDSKYWLVRQEK